MRTKKILIGIIILVFMIAVGKYLFDKYVLKVNAPGNMPIESSEDKTPEEALLQGFEIPKGFSMSIFARDIPGARVMAMDANGDIWVTQTEQGKLSLVDAKTGSVRIMLTGLDKPHGIVFDSANKSGCEGLGYLAEETKISQINISCDGDKEEKKAVLGKKILDLPKGDRHYTRTLLIGADGRLYVSIGSTCDVCQEKDERISSVYSMKTDGTDLKKVAKGLRNSVFMAVNPVNGKIYATEMGRDNLGDNLPPDEINIIESKNGAAQNYGWPICYGKNIHDTEFDKNTYIRNPCMEPFEIPSFVDLPAHSAPLGLAFVSEEGWPEEYWYNLLVAYHGSWNSSTPTGYKIVRVKINSAGKYLGTEDFITGWLSKDGKKVGRPVDIKILPGGTAYISDDFSGVIYKLVRTDEI